MEREKDPKKGRVVEIRWEKERGRQRKRAGSFTHLRRFIKINQQGVNGAKIFWKYQNKLIRKVLSNVKCVLPMQIRLPFLFTLKILGL